MTPDPNYPPVWGFINEAVAFDGSAKQVEQFAERYSRHNVNGIREIALNNERGFDSFSNEQKANIVKATVLLEATGNFSPGSAHPAIPIIQQIRDACSECSDSLDEWIINNSKNVYLPWGFNRGRLKSWAEVQQRDAKRARKAVIQEKTDALARIEKRRVKEAKAGVEVIKAQRNIFNAIRRKDLKAIEAMIAKGVDLDKPNDEGKSPRAYAEELGDEKVLELMG